MGLFEDKRPCEFGRPYGAMVHGAGYPRVPLRFTLGYSRDVPYGNFAMMRHVDQPLLRALMRDVYADNREQGKFPERL